MKGTNLNFDPDTGEIFENTEPELQIDPELLENIDLDEIDKESAEAAAVICSDLSAIYFDEVFMSEHPELKRRLDHELESLRILVKMRKSDERIHDINMRAIQSCPENASLYRALSQTQSSLLNIQKQIDETVKNINTLLKSAQLEINFPTERSDDDQQLSNLHRGSKSFIEQMNKKRAQEN